jgi:hypothetical protein
MAKGFKSGGKDFRPGQSGNPKGRPALPEDIKEARTLNKLEFERIVNKYLYLTPDEILAIVNSHQAPSIELMIASIINSATKHGDHFRLNFLLDRVIGPIVKEAKIKEETKIRLAYAFDDEGEDGEE